MTQENIINLAIENGFIRNSFIKMRDNISGVITSGIFTKYKQYATNSLRMKGENFEVDLITNGILNFTVVQSKEILNLTAPSMPKIKIPEYTTIAIISTDDFIAAMDTIKKSEGEVKYSKEVKGRKLHWYNLISENNLKCPASNDDVAYCGYDIHNTNKSFHFNFYNKNGELFTIDHKMPLSLGGRDHIDNIQPMIGRVNWKKGSKLIYL
jgi:hypothetical protein